MSPHIVSGKESGQSGHYFRKSCVQMQTQSSLTHGENKKLTATKRNHLDRNQLKKDMLHNGPLNSDLVLNIYIYIYINVGHIFLKSLLNLLKHCFSFMFCFLAARHVGS